MNKKVLYGSIAGGVVVVGGAIAIFATTSGEGVNSSPISLDVKSATWIVPDDTTPSKSKGYLAVKVKVTNKTDKQVTLSSSDFKLKNDSGSAIKATSYYDDTDMNVLGSADKVGGKESVTGYVVYKVDKGVKKDYTMSIGGYTGDYDDMTPATTKLDVSKYKDNTEVPVKALKAYINSVYLGKDDANYSKYVGNDLTDEKADFLDAWDDELDSIFYDVSLTDDAKKETLQKFQAANVKKGSVEYKIESVSATKAKIDVTPTLISLRDMSSAIDDVIDEVLDANPDASYDDANNAVVSQVVDKFDEAVATFDTKKGSTTTITLTKENGRWVMSDSDKELLENAFTGSIY